MKGLLTRKTVLSCADLFSLIKSGRFSMMKDFVWHSSVGMDFSVHKSSICDKLPRTAGIMASFISASDSKLLIHKASHALWKISDDGEHVEAVTAADVLSNDEFNSGDSK